MKHHSLWRVLLFITIASFSASLFIPRAYSQDRDDRGYDRDRDRDHDRDRHMDEHRHFDDRDRRVLTDWYRDHSDRFEPGDRDRWNNEEMEHALQANQRLDDRMRHWSRPVPDELASRLGPLPQYWRYVMLGYNICIVDADWTIRDVYHFDQFNDRDRRTIEDWNRDHPDALKQFLGGFGVRIDNGDLDRRLQVGNVVDPDLRDRARPAPRELEDRLSVPPREWRYVIIGDRLCLVDRDWRVHESFHFQHG